ncbi:unnamed protein product, partial [Ectocarpus sp. 6 AP-2014]
GKKQTNPRAGTSNKQTTNTVVNNTGNKERSRKHTYATFQHAIDTSALNP